MYKGKIELSYMWMQETVFESAGINLSDEFHFKYNYYDKELYISKKDYFIENFWGSENISITGIVGENGAGKTSILRYLRDAYHVESNSEQIRIYYVDNRIEIYCKKGMIKKVFYDNEEINTIRDKVLYDSINRENVEFSIRKEYESNADYNNEYEFITYYVDVFFIVNAFYNEIKKDGYYKTICLTPAEKTTFIYYGNSIEYFQNSKEIKFDTNT